MKRVTALVLCSTLLAACSTVTVNPSGTQKRADDPTWSDRKDYFFWGLAGEETIDLQRVCDTRGVAQTQAQTTFVDGLLGGLTLGIWAPRHARVWCK